MNVEIRPEPEDAERKALGVALARLELPDASPYASAWRRAGLTDDKTDSG